MKKKCFFKFFFLFLFIFSNAYAENYIIQFQAKVKNLKEFNISESEKFRSYELEGTFTDNYGNYGKIDTILVSDIKKGKVLKLETTSETIFSNNEKLYSKAFRENSEIDAGIAKIKIIGATKKLKPMIGTECLVSVRYFEDAIFGLQKCSLSKNVSSILKNDFN